MNVATIPDMRKRFKTTVGLSDHTLSNDVSVTAAALGASIIEKHLTLRRADGGPDASFSLEPQEFEALVASLRTVERAIGKPRYFADADRGNIVFRKSLFAVQDIKKGERFTPENVRSIRPGSGLAPKFYRQVIGKRASKDIERATPLSFRHIARK